MADTFLCFYHLIPECFLERKFAPGITLRSQGMEVNYDFYCQELRLVLHHCGSQWYEYAQCYHGTLVEFEKDQGRIERSRQKCRELGLTLVEIPWYFNEEQIEQVLHNCLEGV